jgi:hypothetical protein
MAGGEYLKLDMTIVCAAGWAGAAAPTAKANAATAM